MAEGLSGGEANALLNSIGNASAHSVPGVYVALHVGPPGASGTANPATEVTRKAVSFAAAAGGAMANDATITWTSIAGSQDATHFAAWDSVSGGAFLFSGTVVAPAYTAGDTLTVAVGALTVSLSLAS